MHQVSKDPFELLIRVKYAECDAQAVVFNARYADYADIAATEFMREALGGYQTIIDQGLDNQVVSLKIDWQHSAKFDDILSLTVNVTKVGNTSFYMKIEMKDCASKRVVAIAQLVYVMVATTDFKKTPIPQKIKEQLLHGAPNVSVNMAGIKTLMDSN